MYQILSHWKTGCLKSPKRDRLRRKMKDFDVLREKLRVYLHVSTFPIWIMRFKDLFPIWDLKSQLKDKTQSWNRPSKYTLKRLKKTFFVVVNNVSFCVKHFWCIKLFFKLCFNCVYLWILYRWINCLFTFCFCFTRDSGFAYSFIDK